MFFSRIFQRCLLRAHDCVFADLRRPPGELCHLGPVAVPQSGLRSHAVPLHHRPGGHVFPGNCPLLPGRPGEGRGTVSDSHVVGLTKLINVSFTVWSFVLQTFISDGRNPECAPRLNTRAWKKQLNSWFLF